MRKISRKYYFSVEGDTEFWYLQRLAALINEDSSGSQCRVSFDVKVEKNPMKRVRGLSIIGKTDIWHFCDYESDAPEHDKAFHETMDCMKQAMQSGKQVKYHLGYSNLSFDLWIILHKVDCFGVKADRSQYLSEVNQAFGKQYQNMDQYKSYDNFKECLMQIKLPEVRAAIGRAKTIATRNEKSGHRLLSYRGFSYYRENPSLSVWEVVEALLSDCGL